MSSSGASENFEMKGLCLEPKVSAISDISYTDTTLDLIGFGHLVLTLECFQFLL